MNCRTLRRLENPHEKAQKKRWDQLQPEEWVNLEDNYMSLFVKSHDNALGVDLDADQMYNAADHLTGPVMPREITGLGTVIASTSVSDEEKPPTENSDASELTDLEDIAITDQSDDEEEEV